MKRFPKLRPCAWDGLIVLVIALLAVFCSMTVWGTQNETPQDLTVVISMDGEAVERFPLSDFPDREQSYTNNGYTLQVILAEELLPDEYGVQVVESDCPTQDCVHTGTITRGGQSIVCLPARIVIELEGGSGTDDGPDLVIG